jgi:hypothetical protein
MSNTTSHRSPRRVAGKVRRESSNRQRVRQTLHNGNWDDLPTQMPTHAFYTGVEVD